MLLETKKNVYISYISYFLFFSTDFYFMHQRLLGTGHSVPWLSHLFLALHLHRMLSYLAEQIASQFLQRPGRAGLGVP